MRGGGHHSYTHTRHTNKKPSEPRTAPARFGTDTSNLDFVQEPEATATTPRNTQRKINPVITRQVGNTSLAQLNRSLLSTLNKVLRLVLCTSSYRPVFYVFIRMCWTKHHRVIAKKNEQGTQLLALFMFYKYVGCYYLEMYFCF